MPRKIFKIFLAVCAAILACLMPLTAHAVELPDYVVVESLEDGIEIRDYPSLLIAEVTVSGERDRAANMAFRKLAGFIFGGNDTKTSIKMTAPVVQTPQGEGQWVVNFMMPSKFNRDNLPAPDNADIRIRETEPVRVVSLRFKGRAGAKSLAKRHQQILDYTAAQGFETIGAPYYAFYDAPMVPGPFRRNEVHIRLKSQRLDEAALSTVK